MNCIEKVVQLKKYIGDVLAPLIDNDYLYLDLPYYNNLGDTLIWKGTEDFLSALPYKCLFSASANNRKLFSMKCDKDVLILLHGGGNFGDLWLLHNNFRKKVIAAMPDHKVIILPQTVFYEDRKHLEEDARFYSNYPNVSICARDKNSYKLLKENFPRNNIFLLPDMAFCMNIDKRKKSCYEIKDSLFVKRMDKEFVENKYYSLVPKDATISDWPTFVNKEYKEYKYLRILNRYCSAIDRRLNTNIDNIIIDLYWKKILKNKNVNLAINFIEEYKNIYTTRLHAVILSVILNKPNITVFDNNYGKNSSFVDTWLYDVDVLKLLK